MLHFAMQIHGYELALLIAAFILEAGIVFRMTQSGLSKEYPSLFRYLVANLAAMVATPFFLRYATVDVYDYFYWFCSLVLDCLALGVMLELFRDIFKPYEALRRFANVMFRWIVAVLVLVSVATTMSGGKFELTTFLSCGSMLFDRGLMIVQCGIVLFLLLSAGYLGISLRHRVFGIAIGFGITASVSLLVLSSVHLLKPAMVAPMFALQNATGRVGDLIWLIYFCVPQPERRLSEVQPESRRWEYALSSVTAPAPEALFLTSIDRTVERLLTKNNVATQQKTKEEKHWFGD